MLKLWGSSRDGDFELKPLASGEQFLERISEVGTGEEKDVSFVRTGSFWSELSTSNEAKSLPEYGVDDLKMEGNKRDK